MPGTNLTREEANQRSQILSVDTYKVELDLTVDSETQFGSTTTIAFKATAGSSTFVDLVDAEINTIELNGQVVDSSAYKDNRIALENLAAENVLVVSGKCTYSRIGEGLHRFVDPADNKVYLYTQFEVPDARKVYATFEQPDLKATFEFHVTAPAHWAVVSNSPSPKPEDLGDGKAIWRFAPTKRISTYITALIAGEYESVHDAYRGEFDEIPLGIYYRSSLAQYVDADDLFLITKQGFGFFESAFNMAYPFGKYDQLFVPEYNMGAMENAGAVTFRDELIFRSRQTVAAFEQRANTILHEMAHMWFGDLVTMKWWDDLWLNESFAEWAAHHSSVKATRFTDAWTGFTNSRKNWAYRQDQLPSTHPIAADNYDLEAVEANFDGITYAKGASTLKQLVAWVGEEDFLAGLRSYFAKHAYSNTELKDLLGELEASSGRELGEWAAEWLQTSGVNTLHAEFEVDSAGAYSKFAVAQSAIPEYPTLRRHRIGIGMYNLKDGKLVCVDSIEVDIDGALTEIEQLVGKRQPDLLLLNDRDLTYAKIRLDERSLNTAIAHVADIEDSLARALIWGAAWDMTRDAQMRPGDFVSLVLSGVATETDLTAVSALLLQGRSAITLFASDANRDALWDRWENALHEFLHSAKAGSDHQLAFARAVAAIARSQKSAELLRGLLDGSTTVPGLVVDPELRWTLLTGLARMGRVSDGDIARELELDKTITGKESAASVNAARPDTKSKAEAWEMVVEREDVPNETMRSAAESFDVAGQAEVLQPYVERYLEMADTIAERRGVWIASTALILLFPKANPSEETLAKVDAWLAKSTAPAFTKRYVSEGRDDLARSLRARAADK